MLNYNLAHVLGVSMVTTNSSFYVILATIKLSFAHLLNHTNGEKFNENFPKRNLESSGFGKTNYLENNGTYSPCCYKSTIKLIAYDSEFVSIYCHSTNGDEQISRWGDKNSTSHFAAPMKIENTFSFDA